MRKLWIALALAAGLVVVGLLVLPLVVDVDRYRGLIESKAEQSLGLEVTLGEIDLSLWPLGVRVASVSVAALAADGGAEIVGADGVTVGARLLPLLSKRLEVTSITVEAPRLTIARGPGGSWDLVRLLARPEAQGGGSGEKTEGAGSVLVRDLRIEDGVVVVRDAGPGRNEPLVLTLTDVGIEVEELAAGRPIAFELTARIAERDDSALAVGGTIDTSGENLALDLVIRPSSLPAAEVAKLLVLAGSPSPVAFDSTEPIRFEGTVRGPLGAGRVPEIRAEARLSGLTLAHPSLKQPVREVGARVALMGQRLEVRELTGVVGSSDIAGELTVESFTPPRVGFDLHSRQADFDELFSFLTEEEPAAAGEGSGARSGDDPLEGIELQGKLAIEHGRFATLDFSDLDTTVSFAKGVLALDPLGARLYDGRFLGALTARPLADPPSFTIDGKTEAIDLGLFLTDNLDMPALLSGRLDGTLVMAGTGTEIAEILPGLDGSGAIQVADGRVGELNVLETLSTVSGLFGETTLKQLGDKLAAEGTPFEKLASKLRMSGGRLYLDDLIFEVAEFGLVGNGAIDLTTGEIDGAFRLAFSPAVSAALVGEDSLAAKLFWNPEASRVELPFTLSGPFSSPRPGVDLEGVARKRVEQELRGRLTQELGTLLSEKLGATSAGATGSAAERKPGALPAPRTHEDLAIEFSGTRWRGSLLARDLEVSGSVSGRNIARASLAVVDADGNTAETLEIEAVRTWVAATADRSARASVPWKAKVKGERLLLGKPPYTVAVTLSNDAGESAVATLPVDR